MQNTRGRKMLRILLVAGLLQTALCGIDLSPCTWDTYTNSCAVRASDFVANMNMTQRAFAETLGQRVLMRVKDADTACQTGRQGECGSGQYAECLWSFNFQQCMLSDSGYFNVLKRGLSCPGSQQWDWMDCKMRSAAGSCDAPKSGDYLYQMLKNDDKYLATCYKVKAGVDGIMVQTTDDDGQCLPDWYAAASANPAQRARYDQVLRDQAPSTMGNCAGVKMLNWYYTVCKARDPLICGAKADCKWTPENVCAPKLATLQRYLATSNNTFSDLFQIANSECAQNTFDSGCWNYRLTGRVPGQDATQQVQNGAPTDLNPLQYSELGERPGSKSAAAPLQAAASLLLALLAALLLLL